MIALPELHNLIRSLNKPEKRFFKLLSATENYPVDRAIALFDHVEKINDNDDVYLKTEKTDKIDLSAENLDLLYRLILKSQRNFYSESITGFTLNDELTNLKILFEKAQYKQCRKMIKSVKDRALKNEKFSYLLEILELEKKLLHTEVLGHEYPGYYNVLKAEKEKTIECEKNVGIYYQLYARLKFHIKSKTPKGKKTHDTFYEKFLSEPYIKDTRRAMSRKSLFLLMKCRALCYTAMKDFTRRRDQLNELKTLMQADELIFDEMPRQYIDVLYNLGNVYIESGDYGPAKKILSEIQSLLNNRKLVGLDLRIKATSYTFNLDLALLILSGKHTQAAELAQTIYEFIKENQKIFNKEDKSVLLYNLVNFHICNRDYSMAYRILEVSKADNDRDSRWDLKAYSRIQEMVICYELNEQSKFVLAANAATNLLKEKIFQSETEEAFIGFFLEVIRGKTALDFSSLFNQLSKLLKKEEDTWINYFYFNFYAYAGYKAGAGSMTSLMVKVPDLKEESLV